MHYLTTEPIATHKGEGWNEGEETNFYNEKEYTIIEIVTRETKKQIAFRNVGDKNPGSALQFSISEYSYKTNRTKLVSFSIPLELSKLFIDSLQKQK